MPGGDTRIFGHAAFPQIICRLEERPNPFDEISPSLADVSGLIGVLLTVEVSALGFVAENH